MDYFILICRQLFKDFNPKSTQDAIMKDKWIPEAFNKLFETGVGKTI